MGLNLCLSLGLSLWGGDGGQPEPCESLRRLAPSYFLILRPNRHRIAIIGLIYMYISMSIRYILSRDLYIYFQ
jgi:hypothetical protein